MLRRRHKTPKVQAPREGGTARTPRSRRRAREDAPVPPELRISAQKRAPQADAKAPIAKPQQREQPAPKPAEPPKPAPKAPETAKPAPKAPESAKPAPKPQPPQKAPVKAAPPAKPQPHRLEPDGVVLVTGFEPFDGDDTNPSWEACTRLPREI